MRLVEELRNSNSRVQVEWSHFSPIVTFWPWVSWLHSWLWWLQGTIVVSWWCGTRLWARSISIAKAKDDNLTIFQSAFNVLNYSFIG